MEHKLEDVNLNRRWRTPKYLLLKGKLCTGAMCLPSILAGPFRVLTDITVVVYYLQKHHEDSEQ